MEAAAVLTIFFPQQCPACGAVLPDQGACTTMYRRMFQSPCAETLKLYRKVPK